LACSDDAQTLRISRMKKPLTQVLNVPASDQISREAIELPAWLA
jgi:hypothetical protein